MKLKKKIRRGWTPEERFEDFYIPEPNSGCWLWFGCWNVCGYGVLGVNGKSILAHRFSYQKYRSSIPNNKNVLHHCDVRCCVNPAHLFIGTQLTNVRDMECKGRSRHPNGEAHGRAKLTAIQASEIRSSKESNRKLATRYDVSHFVVGQIKRGRIWKTIQK